MHDISLITTIALGLTGALLFGLLAKRFGLSPIVGYLVAGIAVGPHTPGWSGDVKLAGQLAEIGVILLMFGVGLHLHLKDLLAVRSIAIPGALGQSVAATLACTVVAVAVGWNYKSAIVLGIAVSVASTVVLLRALMDHGVVETPQGHVAIGWLVVEDIVTVLVLVLLPPLAASGSESSLFNTLGLALLKLSLLTALIMLAGARIIPALLLRVARLRSRELFTLTVLVIALSVATISYVAFGASMALGAFLAGMVVGQSKVSHQVASDALPMRDAFAVLFFVSVGMLFDPRVLVDSPWLVLGVIVVILVIKPLVALLIVIMCGHSLRTALTVAAGLAQIGEFSFILAETAKSFGLMPGNGSNVLVAGAIVSISLNPIIFKRMTGWEMKLQRIPWLTRLLAQRGGKLAVTGALQNAGRGEEPVIVRSIVVGYGPVGQTVTRLLQEFGVKPTIIEMNVDTVLELQKQGHKAIYGDATRTEILDAAELPWASFLVLTVPQAEISATIIRAAREMNPTLRILVRANYLNLQKELQEAGASVIRYDEAEAAAALARALLQEIQVPSNQIVTVVERIRQELDPKPKAARGPLG